MSLLNPDLTAASGHPQAPTSEIGERVTFTYLSDADDTDEVQELIRGLTHSPKTIPPQYFYDHHGSALFEQICHLPEYYPTRTEAAILQAYAPAIAEITGTCELVELGSGSSSKTRLLFTAYQAQGNLFHYIPIDVSHSALKNSTLQLQQDYPTLSIQALVGSYEQALTYLSPSSHPTRMIFFLGSSLGNFSPPQCDRFLRRVAEVLARGDYFLLGIDLVKDIPILEAAYNDTQGVTAAFNLNILSHLNWRFQGNFSTPAFTHQAIYNQPEQQIEMYLTAQKAQNVKLQTLDLNINLQPQEAILTEISRKFDRQQIQLQLESTGLLPRQTYTDPNNWFALILCQKL